MGNDKDFDEEFEDETEGFVDQPNPLAMEEGDGEEEEAVSDNDFKTKPDLEKFLDRNDRDIDIQHRHFGIKILLVGAENPAWRDAFVRVGISHTLMSWYYARHWLAKHTVDEIAQEVSRFKYVFLDSGAFTFLNAKRKGKKIKENAREYADKFYDEIKRYGHLFSGIAEVDLENDLGMEYMEQKRREMKDHGLTMVPVIQGQPLKEYEDRGWFEDFTYIGMGSALFARKYAAYRSQMFKYARRNGCVMHGLAGTGTEVIQRSQFYSVDSSSWVAGGKFGTTSIFQNGRLRHYDSTKKSVRKRYKKRLIENGIVWEAIEADEDFEVNIMNALAWKQWADSIKYTTTRCYWLTEEEKKKAVELKSRMFNTEGLINRNASVRRAESRRLNIITNLDYDDRAHETLHCDSCHLEGRCPRYEPGSACGYDVNIKLETKQDVQRAMQLVLETQHDRVMTGALFEKLEGGVIDRNLTQEMQSYMTMLQAVQGTYEGPHDELHINIKTKTAAGGGGGLATALAGVFSSTGPGKSGSGNTVTQRAANALSEQNHKDVLDVEAESVKEPVKEPVPTGSKD